MDIAETPPPALLSAATAAEMQAIATELDQLTEDAREERARAHLPTVVNVLEELNSRARRSHDSYDVSFAATAKGLCQAAGDAVREGFPAGRHLATAARHLAIFLPRHPEFVSAPMMNFTPGFNGH